MTISADPSPGTRPRPGSWVHNLNGMRRHDLCPEGVGVTKELLGQRRVLPPQSQARREHNMRGRQCSG